MNISITNITTYLTTLTLTQLTKELNRVSNQYQGAQIRFMSDTSYESWQAHISLIEEEIERREITPALGQDETPRRRNEMTNIYVIWAQNKRAMVKGCTTDLDKAEHIYNKILKDGRSAFITINFVSPQVEHYTPQQIRKSLEVIS